MNDNAPDDRAAGLVSVARRIYQSGEGVFFSRADLDEMPWQIRELIEAEAIKLYGPRRT